MIAIDTSALMAILLNEPKADACLRAIEAETDIVISAGTVAEALIVSGHRKLGAEMVRLLDGLGLTIMPVTPRTASRIAAAHALWGKGFHPAALNFGDCFSYAAAEECSCPLLFVGNDFARTDLTPVL